MFYPHDSFVQIQLTITYFRSSHSFSSCSVYNSFAQLNLLTVYYFVVLFWVINLGKSWLEWARIFPRAVRFYGLHWNIFFHLSTSCVVQNGTAVWKWPLDLLRRTKIRQMSKWVCVPRPTVVFNQFCQLECNGPCSLVHAVRVVRRIKRLSCLPQNLLPSLSLIDNPH